MQKCEAGSTQIDAKAVAAAAMVMASGRVKAGPCGSALRLVVGCHSTVRGCSNGCRFHDSRYHRIAACSGLLPVHVAALAKVGAT